MKHFLLFALLFSAGMVFAGNFEADCKKVEKWISETYPQRSLSRRMQENNLRRLRKSGDSAALHRQFPKAFGEEWISELETAKAQGITFSDDNKTLLKCPENVTSVVIPSCVTTIGDQAFNGCSNLTSVSIPDSVTTIGIWAFVFCSNLTSVSIPDSVTTIGEGAFFGCSNLTSVSIPDSVTTIGDLAFSECSNLTSVSIPDSVTTIGDGAFFGVESVKLSKNNPVFMIDEFGALLDVENNKLLYLPSNTKGKYTIPDGVTTIGIGVFSFCSNLTSVSIPDSVTTIGIGAFGMCSNLTSVSIPDSVTTIGDGAFIGVKSVKLSKNNPVFMIDEFGALLDVENNKLLYLPSNTEGKYTIPDGVTTIGALAFWMCSNLTSISIPGSVTTIENRAFLGCSNLTSVSIPDSVTTIGDLAFLGCSNLTSVSIPSNCNVGSLAFPDNCKVIRK